MAAIPPGGPRGEYPHPSRSEADADPAVPRRAREGDRRAGVSVALMVVAAILVVLLIFLL